MPADLDAVSTAFYLLAFGSVTMAIGILIGFCIDRPRRGS